MPDHHVNQFVRKTEAKWKNVLARQRKHYTWLCEIPMEIHECGSGCITVSNMRNENINEHYVTYMC